VPDHHRQDVLELNDIFARLSVLKLAVYAPIGYILPSRLAKYEEIYDTQVEGGRGKLRQADRERSLQALMTTNLLKRRKLCRGVPPYAAGAQRQHHPHPRRHREFERSGGTQTVSDYLADVSLDDEDDDLGGVGEFTVAEGADQPGGHGRAVVEA
jgi:hypothetical protein